MPPLNCTTAKSFISDQYPWNFISFNLHIESYLAYVNACVLFCFQAPSTDVAVSDLSHASAEVSEVVFFLLGAMTIVEIVDAHQGFKLVTDNITSRKPRTLLWVVSALVCYHDNNHLF